MKFPRMTEDQRRLVEENIGFAFSMAYKSCTQYRCLRNYRDDVLSLAFAAMCKAATLYDPDYRANDGRPVKFVTLARAWILSEIKTYVTRTRKNPRQVIYLPRHLQADRGVGKTRRQRERARKASAVSRMQGQSSRLFDTLEDTKSSPDVGSESSDLWQELERLPFRTQNILINRCIKGYSFARIGREMMPQLTRERVRQLCEEGLADLRWSLTNRSGE